MWPIPIFQESAEISLGAILHKDIDIPVLWDKWVVVCDNIMGVDRAQNIDLFNGIDTLLLPHILSVYLLHNEVLVCLYMYMSVNTPPWEVEQRMYTEANLFKF